MAPETDTSSNAKRWCLCTHHDLVVDLFAGGGGASVGIEAALGPCEACQGQRRVDIGLNHDWDALAVHYANHPHCKHLVEGIERVDPLDATKGKPVALLWASPDCKHFSRAKGGRPVEASIRLLAWQVVTWAERAAPETILLENVKEFRDWGPLHEEHSHGCEGRQPCKYKKCADSPLSCEHGHCLRRCQFSKAIKARKGETYAEWAATLRGLGYSVESKRLVASQYGTPTSRERLFVVCRRDGSPAVWPEPTHGPEGSGLLPFRTAAECIDWSDLGTSIFGRVTKTGKPDPLAPATCRRIARGIVKFVLQDADPFVVGVGGRAGQSLETGSREPLGTITAKNDRGVVIPHLINTRNGERKGQAPRCLNVREPMRTITAQGSQGALASAWVVKNNTGVVGNRATEPMSTLTATPTLGVVGATLNGEGSQDRSADVYAFVTTYYGQSVGRRVDEPLGTVTTKQRHGLVTVEIDGETYTVTDITFRMLKPFELQLAQGFPADYRIEGSQRVRNRLIGNSVCPQLSEALVRANVEPRRRLRVAS